MKTAALFGGLWVVTVGGAWWLGREGAPKPDPVEHEAGLGTAAAAEGSSAAALEGRGRPETPVLSGVPAAPRPAAVAGAPEASGGLKRPAVAVVPADKPLDLTDLKTPEEFLARFFAYAAAHLAGGDAEHKELYKTFSSLVQKGSPVEALFGDEEAGVRHLYPVIRFLMDRDAQVVDYAETVLKTVAEEPSFFEGEERDEALEILMEGIGPMLPGMVSEERLERLRGYVKKALAMPEDQLPKVLKGTRRELERLLAYWTPPLPSAEAAARLREGAFTGREALTLLARVEPKDREGLDYAAILGPLLAGGDYRAMSEVGRLGVDGRQLAMLDARVIDGAAAGSVREYHLVQWLAQTKRTSWSDSRVFVEETLRRGPPASDVMAMALRQLPNGPSATDVESLLRTYRFSDRIVTAVRSQFGLR